MTWIKRNVDGAVTRIVFIVSIILNKKTIKLCILYLDFDILKKFNARINEE